MQNSIHPKYEAMNVVCSCGTTFKTRSTKSGDMRLEICSKCHPFFKGKQKIVDTAKRVKKFYAKYSRKK